LGKNSLIDVKERNGTEPEKGYKNRDNNYQKKIFFHKRFALAQIIPQILCLSYLSGRNPGFPDQVGE
jgi:hypothetical protein